MKIARPLPRVRQEAREQRSMGVRLELNDGRRADSTQPPVDSWPLTLATTAPFGALMVNRTESLRW